MKNILMVLLVILSFTSVAAQDQPHKKRARKMYVFVVGVCKYAYPTITTLTQATNDADTIAAIFRNPNNEIMVLKDEEATGDSVKTKMARFFSHATKNDNVMFFFSGHGTPSSFCCQDFMMTVEGALTYTNIKNIFNKVHAHAKFIIADACYSGGVREKPDTTKMKHDLPTSDARNNQQVVLFLSSRGYETSHESRTMKNGFFTTYLREGLRGSADANKNGNVTAIELHSYVTKRLTNTLGNSQHCVMWGNFDPNLIIKRLNKDN